MDHAITIGEILYVVVGLMDCGLAVAALAGILWFMAQGWDH